MTPGSTRLLTPKAMNLDDLSESLRRAGEVGLTSITVTTPAKKTLTLTLAQFNIAAINSWIARASDSPDVLAPPAKGMSIAPKGVDLTLEVPFPMSAEVTRYLQQRAAIPVRVLKVGDGLSFKAGDEAKDAATMGDLQGLLKSATAVPGQKDHSIVVRPIWADLLVDEGDPGTFTYTVPQLAASKELEWWHLELQPTQAGLFWHDLADDFGLDGKVLEAKEPDTSTPGPIFVGGAGMGCSRFALTTKRTEPPNQVKSLERPSA
jgi:hypothetical protein